MFARCFIVTEKSKPLLIYPFNPYPKPNIKSYRISFMNLRFIEHNGGEMHFRPRGLKGVDQ